MKKTYRLFRRKNGIYYLFNNLTLQRESLQTNDEDEAETILHARNEATRQPALNLQMARAYLSGSDSGIATRTWSDAMQSYGETKTGPTRERWLRAIKQPAFARITSKLIAETRAEDLLAVLKAGTVATNVFLRRLHNFVLGMGWLAWPILPKKQWPAVRFGDKRGITLEEHQLIIAREQNEERRAFYELCWHLGGSQSDIACLQTEDVDWSHREITYSRKKTKTAAHIRFSDAVAEILKTRPRVGPLFPYLATVRSGDRATEFKQRCTGLGIAGVTLHSYRYAWAERARSCGYPEREAREALGHNSKAVHRAYAKKAQVTIRALDEFERERKVFERAVSQDEERGIRTVQA